MLHAKPKEDTYLHKGIRKKLIESLEKKGIHDKKVLEAMNAVPRHFFLDPAFEQYAYEDRPFVIAENQTISQPYTVAFMSQMLEIKKFDKVLEVGTGSAYQACVLAQLGAIVYTIERQKELYEIANNFFYLKNYTNIKRFFGDGFAGLPNYAPFDKIIVTCGAPFIPPKLVEQLKPNGVMAIPVGEGANQRMLRIKKDASGTIEEKYMGEFSFVPMLTGKNARQ